MQIAPRLDASAEDHPGAITSAHDCCGRPFVKPILTMLCLLISSFLSPKCPALTLTLACFALQGAVPGCKKRLITLRQSLYVNTSRSALEDIKLKFIDTASKIGHGRFQTTAEKMKTLGRLKEAVA